MEGRRTPGAGEGMAELLEALQLASCGPDRFVASNPDWWGERLFGGMVLAQALRAASHTLEGPLRPHSMHGYFLRPVIAGTDSVLAVERVRDSRSFSTRQVDTVQEGALAARVTCSFCVEERGGESYQLPMPPGVPAPEDLEVGLPPGPFEARDAGPVLSPDGTFASSGRFWTRAVGGLPEEATLHACVLALMSDMTRTSFRPLSLDLWGGHTDASLDHALWFHRPASAEQWLLYDLVAVINLDNRATVRGAMFKLNGELVLTMAQELLIRPLGGGGPVPWLAEKF